MCWDGGWRRWPMECGKPDGKRWSLMLVICRAVCICTELPQIDLCRRSGWCWCGRFWESRVLVKVRGHGFSSPGTKRTRTELNCKGRVHENEIDDPHAFCSPPPAPERGKCSRSGERPPRQEDNPVADGRFLAEEEQHV